jgi:hypothetical protein
MAQPELTLQLALLEEAKIVLLCRMDDTYDRFNPKGRHYETLKELWNSDITIVVFLQQLRGTNGKRREVASNTPPKLPIVSDSLSMIPDSP